MFPREVIIITTPNIIRMDMFNGSEEGSKKNKKRKIVKIEEKVGKV